MPRMSRPAAEPAEPAEPADAAPHPADGVAPAAPPDAGAVDAALDAFAASRPALPLGVAYSGGADSSALLHGCAARFPGQVRALHVHHGLQAAADDFERHARQTCAALGVLLQVQRVAVPRRAGDSPEAAARSARYQAFRALALVHGPLDAIKTIVMAHHADDQLETLLLALSRGGGVAGLAAMPARWSAQGLHWARPLLSVPGAALRAWLAARGLSWIEDPSNADLRFTRNRIRAELLPAIAAQFPAFRQTAARSAAHCAEASALLAELAALDLAACGAPPRIAALQALSPARQANALRAWLRDAHATTPSAAQMAALLAQIDACRSAGHRLHLRVGRGTLMRDGAQLCWQPLPPRAAAR